MSTKTVLFVLAHQDDEVSHSTRIARELASGHDVHCVFLTDGGAYGVRSDRRDAESRAVLDALGVPAANLHFLGSAHAIPDGGLVDHLTRAHALVEAALDGRPLRRVYAMAWEGGHADHDAAHLVALALARSRGLLQRCWQVPLYHAYRMPWRLFHVQSLLPDRRRPLERRLPLGEGLRHTALGFRYPSQRRTWLALLPVLALKRAIQRRELLCAADLAAVAVRPHAGPLLYEKRFGETYERFASAASGFMRTHLS